MVNIKKHWDRLVEKATALWEDLCSRDKTYWYRYVVGKLALLANICNLGIFGHIIQQALPYILSGIILSSLTAGLTIFTFVADPLIYICKALNRIIRHRGRRNGVQFSEQEHGLHSWQDSADIFTAILFLIAIAAFFTPAAIFPLHAFVGWIVGIIGTGINLYFDDIYPAIKAREKFHQETDPEKKATLDKDYKQHFYESIFLGLILFSLALFLPCVSFAQAYTLSATASHVLNIFAVIGQGSIVGLNTLRGLNFLSCNAFYNSCMPGLAKQETSTRGILSSLQQTPTPTLQNRDPQIRSEETKENRPSVQQASHAPPAGPTPVSLLFVQASGDSSNEGNMPQENETQQRKILSCAIL